MEKIALGLGLETNIALGEGLLYWLVYFEQIAKALLGAIERQVTRMVRFLALADHSKAVCHARPKICSLFNSRIDQIATETSFCQECYICPSVLYLPKCAVFSGSWANTARRHKIWK